MPVVVTGAAGFIGRHLVTALAARGHTVVGIDRRSAQLPATLVTADLTGPDAAVDDALHRADAVFHLAGIAGVRASGPAVDARRRRDNVEATRRVLSSVPLDVPLIVTSSSSVYGGSAGVPCHESQPLNPRGAYAVSKVEVERLCAKRVSAGGLVCVARPFTVAGEGQRPDMAIAGWIAAALAGRPLSIFGSPDRTRDLTDVGDVVEGLVRMGQRGVRSTINLGTGTGRRLGDIAAAVHRAVGSDTGTVVAPAPYVEPAATLADTGRCAAMLGFTPATDLQALVGRQVAALTRSDRAAPVASAAGAGR